jgi:hypothetical protein
MSSEERRRFPVTLDQVCETLPDEIRNRLDIGSQIAYGLKQPVIHSSRWEQ